MEDNIQTETEKVVIDDSVIALIKRAIKEAEAKGEVSEDVIKKQIKEHVDFLKLIDEIDISTDDYRVIVTFGTDELVHDDGEFYLVDTIYKGKKKKKLTKKQARDMYIEYFIRYQLNPILENQKVKDMVKELSKENYERQNKELEVKEKAKEQEKAKAKKEKSQKESEKIVVEKKLQEDVKSKEDPKSKDRKQQER